MNEQEWTVEGFYRAVAELLCAPHQYRERPFRYKTRWNNRSPGNGRYEGHGCVRAFSLTTIHVMLRVPEVNGYFKSPDAALDAIRAALNIEK